MREITKEERELLHARGCPECGSKVLMHVVVDLPTCSTRVNYTCVIPACWEAYKTYPDSVKVNDPVMLEKLMKGEEPGYVDH